MTIPAVQKAQFDVTLDVQAYIVIQPDRQMGSHEFNIYTVVNTMCSAQPS